ncbi:MAG TPA: VOC family protein [Polyangia bacterium]|nr:VOC family protein [Polyangia bacterium]
MTSPPSPRGVHHVAIGVRDLPAVEAFYTSVLGLPVQRRWPRAGGGAGDRSVWLDLGGGAFLALESVESPAPGGTRDPGDYLTGGYLMAALAIGREERPRWEARFAAGGVPVVRRTPYTIYVEDPEGNRVGLSHWPEPAEMPPDQP